MIYIQKIMEGEDLNAEEEMRIKVIIEKEKQRNLLK